MGATLCALLIPLLLCAGSRPARAGSWLFHVTANGTPKAEAISSTTTSDALTWTAPSDATNSISLPKYGVQLGDYCTPGKTVSVNCAVSLSVTITATWTHGTGQTDANDPAPPSVEIIETAGAQGYGNDGNGNFQAGSVSDGLGDPVIQGVSSTPTTGPPPPHLSQQSGPSFKLTRTFSATGNTTATIPVGSSMFFLWPLAQAYLNSYTISIHAQPYNFRASGYTAGDGTHRNKAVQDNPNATLALSYVWDSTDGNKSDLTSCTISENVTWDSNPTGVGQLVTNTDGTKYYVLPSPPAGKDAQGHSLAYLDPTVTSKPATDPGITDTFSPDSVYAGPYTNIAWWGDQKYVFSDSATGETATPLPGPAAGTFRITRTVARIGTSNSYGLTISTRGYQAGPMILP